MDVIARGPETIGVLICERCGGAEQHVEADGRLCHGSWMRVKYVRPDLHRGAVEAGDRMAAAVLALETRDDRASWDELMAARSAWLSGYGGGQ